MRIFCPQAMLFLYEKGFPQLGHIQSGNVFIVNDVCLVGGYENTLLGYRTRMYKMCKEHIERLDVIMFGESSPSPSLFLSLTFVLGIYSGSAGTRAMISARVIPKENTSACSQ